jgi:type IV pilus assembly protein PilM
MRKKSVVFELTDEELRAFWFTGHSFGMQGHSSSVLRFDRLPIPTGVIEQGNLRRENVLIDILATYGAQHSNECQRAYLAIPLQQGFIRMYSLPWIPKRDRKSAISLLVDEEISIARSDLLYDFLVLSEEKHKVLRILLGSTRQSSLEQYVTIFGQAGFKVNGVDFAFSILGQAIGFEAYEDVLYLQGQSGSCQVVLFRGAVPESARCLHSQGRTIPLSFAGMNEEGENGQAEEWGNEIRRFLLYYRTQHPDLNLQRLVWSGDSGVELLTRELLMSGYVSAAERAELRNVPASWQKVLEENKGRGEVGIGYGMRILAHRPELNLWRQPNLALTVQKRYRGMALFLGALFLIGTIIWVSIYHRVLSLQQEVEQLSRQGAGIAAQNKHQEEFATSWSKVTSHAEGIGTGLAQIQAMQTLPEAELKIEQLIYKQGSISLRGSAKDARSVQTLIRTLRTKGWEQPVLSGYQLTALPNVEFSLSALQGRIGMGQINPTEDEPEKMLTNVGTALARSE